jgi:hypothetical protein
MFGTSRQRIKMDSEPPLLKVMSCCKFSIDKDAALLHESVLSMGIKWSGPVCSFCPSPSQIQAMSLLLDHFFKSLRNEGETQLIQQFTVFMTTSPGIRIDKPVTEVIS